MGDVRDEGERAHQPAIWERVKSVQGEGMLIFRPRWDTLLHPRSGKRFDRLVLETPDWVNVVALTPQRELVLVRQYRFGTARLTDEIPGGMVDPGEEHRSAAERELREETGYTSERWTYLGCVEPNPAFHDNLCHHWLAEGALESAPQELDGGEDIQVLLQPLETVRRRILAGEIRHSLVIAALARVLDLRQP